MKSWHFVVTIFLLGTCTSTLLAQGSPPMTAKSARLPAYQEKGTRDISQNAWSSWNAPISTVDPSQLVSTDSAETVSNGVVEPHLASVKGDSFQFANGLNEGKPVHVEKSKPIQEVETGNTSMVDVQSAPVVAVAAPKSGSKHILLAAFAGVAVLAYRKFRRTNAGPHPRKPSFL